MKTIEYVDATAFLADARRFLEEKETLNSLILGLAIQLEESGNQALFFSVKQNEEILIVAMQTPPLKLLLSDGDPSALPCFLAYINASTRSLQVPGLTGPRQITKAFAKLWPEKHTIVMRQLVYRLEKVKLPEHPATGYLRPAQESDLDLLVKWRIAFTREAMGETVAEEEIRSTLIQRIPTQSLFIWDDQGPVSMAAVARPTRNGVSVNFVYTPTVHRKKGYASITVAEMSQKMLKQGYQFCTLFTDADFPSSNKIYQSMGYFEVGHFLSIAFEKSKD